MTDGSPTSYELIDQIVENELDRNALKIRIRREKERIIEQYENTLHNERMERQRVLLN